MHAAGLALAQLQPCKKATHYYPLCYKACAKHHALGYISAGFATGPRPPRNAQAQQHTLCNVHAHHSRTPEPKTTDKTRQTSKTAHRPRREVSRCARLARQGNSASMLQRTLSWGVRGCYVDPACSARRYQDAHGGKASLVGRRTPGTASRKRCKAYRVALTARHEGKSPYAGWRHGWHGLPTLQQCLRNAPRACSAMVLCHSSS